MADVVHLTSVHSPFDVRIYQKECRTLASAGHEVVVVAPHHEDAQAGGVRIRGVPKPRSRWIRWTKTIWHVYRAAISEDADVYHLHDPELVPLGWMLRIRRKVVIYDAHEHFAGQLRNKAWIPGPLRLLAAKAGRVLEWLVGHTFDQMVAATPAIARAFPDERTVVVQNYPIREELAPAEGEPYDERPPAVAYVGGITEVRGIRELASAVGLLPAESEVRLVLAGAFEPPELGEHVRRLPGWERIEFRGWLERAEVAELLGDVRAGLVVFHPERNHIEAQPNKLFEYMSVGLPVIASDFPLWREIVDGAGCGILVDPLDPKSIAEAILWIMEHPDRAEAMGKQGKEAVEERYNWRGEGQKMLRLYTDLAG